MGLIYTLVIGIPACIVLCAAGLLLICTVIGAPVGLTLIALGFKSLAMQKRPRVVVQRRLR